MTIQEFICQHNLKNISVMQITGSTAYNTAELDSDVDFLGIFTIPTSEILKTTPVQENYSGTNPDFQIHEAGKFANLLLKGNPTIVEMLYAKRNSYYVEPSFTDAWDFLLKNRDIFLNQATVKQYLGYIENQYSRLIQGKSLHTTNSHYNTKWAYHMMRLSYDLNDIVSGKELEIYKTGCRRSILLDIRRGKYTKSQVSNMILKGISYINYQHLPMNADREFVDNWLLKVRQITWI